MKRSTTETVMMHALIVALVICAINLSGDIVAIIAELINL